jgi:hypothetical protein
MEREVPNEAYELAGDSDTDFVLVQLSPHDQAAVAFGKAQYGLPGDIAHGFGFGLAGAPGFRD